MGILIMFRRSKYLLATVVAFAVLLLTTLGATLVQPARAHAESMDEARTKAIQYGYVKSMGGCINGDQLHRDAKNIQLSLQPDTWMKDPMLMVHYQNVGYLIQTCVKNLMNATNKQNSRAFARLFPTANPTLILHS